MTTNSFFVPAERIESLILLVRKEKVMLDADLKRFPPDFMFELTDRRVVFDANRELMKPPESKRRPVGFRKD